MKLYVLVLFFLSLNAYTWEYLGVKSGMTIDEVMQIENLQKRKKNNTSFSYGQMRSLNATFFKNKDVPLGMSKITIDFTPRTKVLYRMQIIVETRYMDEIEINSIENILKELEITKGMDGKISDSSYVDANGYRRHQKIAILVDHEIRDQEIELVEEQEKPAFLLD
tara:strand:+ start:1751 stop:2248 length:498 start_codon:yes stop_codon:yes gene_type:complete